jgi:hypothetical protein
LKALDTTKEFSGPKIPKHPKKNPPGAAAPSRLLICCKISALGMAPLQITLVTLSFQSGLGHVYIHIKICDNMYIIYI